MEQVSAADTALNNLACSLINLINSVFFAESKISSPGFNSLGGPLESMLLATYDMAQAIIETRTLHENLSVAMRFASLNQLCDKTLKWARERVQFMTETCCARSMSRSSSLDSSFVGNLMVRDIVVLVESVLAADDIEAILMALKRAAETNMYGQESIRSAKLCSGDLQDALRLCSWCRLCGMTMRWALDWASYMMDSATGSEFDSQSIDDDAGGSIALVSDSGFDLPTSSDVDELDASYVLI